MSVGRRCMSLRRKPASVASPESGADGNKSYKAGRLQHVLRRGMEHFSDMKENEEVHQRANTRALQRAFAKVAGLYISWIGRVHLVLANT